MPGLLILLGIALALLMALLVTMMAWQMVHPPRHTAGWALARGLPCDPNDLRLPFEEWWLDRPGGVRLPVWEIASSDQRAAVSDQPDTSAGFGLSAVFVHGWGHSRVDSLQRIGPFLPLVDRVVLYDLRGHGEATGGASTLGDGEDEDLLALIEELGDGPILLVGHSMGAVIALNAAGISPSLEGRGQRGGSSRTMHEGSPHTIAPHPPPSPLPQGRGSLIAGVIAYAPYSDFHRSLRGRLRVNGFPARPLTDLALLVHRLRGIRPAEISSRDLGGLSVPLLIVQGIDDLVVPLADVRSLAQAARSATLLEIDSGAHADAHAIDQSKHDEAVRTFIRNLKSRA